MNHRRHAERARAIEQRTTTVAWDAQCSILRRLALNYPEVDRALQLFHTTTGEQKTAGETNLFFRLAAADSVDKDKALQRLWQTTDQAGERVVKAPYMCRWRVAVGHDAAGILPTIRFPVHAHNNLSEGGALAEGSTVDFCAWAYGSSLFPEKMGTRYTAGKPCKWNLNLLVAQHLRMLLDLVTEIFHQNNPEACATLALVQRSLFNVQHSSVSSKSNEPFAAWYRAKLLAALHIDLVDSDGSDDAMQRIVDLGELATMLEDGRDFRQAAERLGFDEELVVAETICTAVLKRDGGETNDCGMDYENLRGDTPPELFYRAWRRIAAGDAIVRDPQGKVKSDVSSSEMFQRSVVEGDSVMLASILSADPGAELSKCKEAWVLRCVNDAIAMTPATAMGRDVEKDQLVRLLHENAGVPCERRLRDMLFLGDFTSWVLVKQCSNEQAIGALSAALVRKATDTHGVTPLICATMGASFSPPPDFNATIAEYLLVAGSLGRTARSLVPTDFLRQAYATIQLDTIVARNQELAERDARRLEAAATEIAKEEESVDEGDEGAEESKGSTCAPPPHEPSFRAQKKFGMSADHQVATTMLSAVNRVCSLAVNHDVPGLHGVFVGAGNALGTKKLRKVVRHVMERRAARGELPVADLLVAFQRLGMKRSLTDRAAPEDYGAGMVADAVRSTALDNNVVRAAIEGRHPVSRRRSQLRVALARPEPRAAGADGNSREPTGDVVALEFCATSEEIQRRCQKLEGVLAFDVAQCAVRFDTVEPCYICFNVHEDMVSLHAAAKDADHAHALCRPCLKAWTDLENTTCPLCREQIDPEPV